MCPNHLSWYLLLRKTNIVYRFLNLRAKDFVGITSYLKTQFSYNCDHILSVTTKIYDSGQKWEQKPLGHCCFDNFSFMTKQYCKARIICTSFAQTDVNFLVLLQSHCLTTILRSSGKPIPISILYCHVLRYLNFSICFNIAPLHWSALLLLKWSSWKASATKAEDYRVGFYF